MVGVLFSCVITFFCGAWLRFVGRLVVVFCCVRHVVVYVVVCGCFVGSLDALFGCWFGVCV